MTIIEIEEFLEKAQLSYKQVKVIHKSREKPFNKNGIDIESNPWYVHSIVDERLNQKYAYFIADYRDEKYLFGLPLDEIKEVILFTND